MSENVRGPITDQAITFLKNVVYFLKFETSLLLSRPLACEIHITIITHEKITFVSIMSH